MNEQLLPDLDELAIEELEEIAAPGVLVGD
jgi:hypothetical protein